MAELAFPHPMQLQLVLLQDTGEAITYTYHVSKPVTFAQMMGLLEQHTPEKPNAFTYLDEEQDHVTVRNDDELTAMTALYFWECQRLGTKYDLQIIPDYPQKRIVPRTPAQRNPFVLTVNTSAPAAKPTPVAVEERPPPPRSERPDAVDVVDILRSAPIQASDLQLLEVLGYGNGGTVYRALHRRLSLIMAVKLIPVDVTEEVQQQIMSELAILHQCDSEYVIRFYGAFFTENRISICTEYMDGGSLDRYVPIPELVLGRVAIQVVRGMVYLWDQRNGRIMHRDIKPSNMLVSLSGDVKLCDFGVSVQLVNSIARTFVGTNAYMAPERIQGEPYSINSEIWSLGISIVEMAIGRFPYPADSIAEPSEANTMLAIELLQMVVYEDPPVLPVPPFSLHFSDFCSQCMRKRPEQRISIGELLNHPFMRAMSDNNRDLIAMFVRDKIDHSSEAAMSRQRQLEQQMQQSQQQQQQQQASGAAPGTVPVLASAASAEQAGGYRMPSPYTSQRHDHGGPATPIIPMKTDAGGEEVDSAGTVTVPWDNVTMGDPCQAHPLAEELADLDVKQPDNAMES